VFRLKKAGGRPDIFTPDAMDMIFRTSKGIPRTINLLCDSALVYAFADEATEIDTRILERVIEELGFMGLYDKREFETASEPTIGEKVKGNGFLKRLAKLEDMVNNIQMQVEQQDIESRKRINEYTRELVAKLKVHLRNERKRNRGMFEENARLKRQLSELESLRVKNNSG
jgi:general secretion pathway protein A